MYTPHFQIPHFWSNCLLRSHLTVCFFLLNFVIVLGQRDCKPRIFIETSVLSAGVTEHSQNIVYKQELIYQHVVQLAVTWKQINMMQSLLFCKVSLIQESSSVSKTFITFLPFDGSLITQVFCNYDINIRPNSPARLKVGYRRVLQKA